jgi:hypothetical protein
MSDLRELTDTELDIVGGGVTAILKAPPAILGWKLCVSQHRAGAEKIW